MEVKTDRHLKTVLPEPGKKVRTVPCGDNLYLIVRDLGGGKIRRWWSLRFRLDGRAYERGLGACDGPNAISLSKAKKACKAKIAKIKETGSDEVMAKQQAKADEVQAEAERRAIEEGGDVRHGGRRVSRHPRRRVEQRDPPHQWEQSLADFASPHIGKLDVREITNTDIRDALRPIWKTKHVTASRVRARIEKVLDLAGVLGFRPATEPNPARWKGNLALMLGSGGHDARHHPALDWRKLPDFMATLAAKDCIGARALESSILTAVRTGEVRGATWSEIDLDAKTWSIPAARMKMKKPHVVPLSTAALAVLKRVGNGSDIVFPSATTADGRLAAMTLLEQVRAIVGMGAATAHGFRSSFADWAADETTFPMEVCEAALAHVVGSAVRRAYRRGDALEQRKLLMQAWADFVRPAAADAKVVPMKRKAGRS